MLTNFDSEFKEKIDFSPISKRGVYLNSYNIEEVDGVISFKPTSMVLGFNSLWIIIGLIPLILGLIMTPYYLENVSGNFKDIIYYIGLIIFGGGLIGFGGTILMDYLKERKFDKINGIFNKGALKGNISDIYGIQIINKVIFQRDNPNYNSYELNLVLKDKNRINLFSSGNLETIEKQGNKLAEYLNCPIEVYLGNKKELY